MPPYTTAQLQAHSPTHHLRVDFNGTATMVPIYIYIMDGDGILGYDPTKIFIAETVAQEQRLTVAASVRDRCGRRTKGDLISYHIYIKS